MVRLVLAQVVRLVLAQVVLDLVACLVREVLLALAQVVVEVPEHQKVPVVLQVLVGHLLEADLVQELLQALVRVQQVWETGVELVGQVKGLDRWQPEEGVLPLPEVQA